MDSPTHRPMKDSDFSFFDSLSSILTSPYFVCPRVAANDGEFGFDPHPSMASLSENASISKIYDGSSTRSQVEIREKWPLQERVKLTKPNNVSPCKHGEGCSYSEACDGARPSTDVSSHVVRHGLITPPPFTSPASNKIPKIVKRSARNSASPRKSHQPRTGASAASASASFVSSSSESNAKSTSKASDRTRKTTRRLRTPVRLLDDQKRKLSLEKNKIAAANCRIKKRKREHCLETQSRELVFDNTILKQSISDMTQHLEELRSMLQVHVLSSGCYAASHIQETLGEQSSHDNFLSMSACDDNGSESMESLHGDLFTPDSSLVPEMVADDWSVPDMLTLEGLSPPWESLLSSLDFEESLEITTPASAKSIYCDPVGR
jgi:hypothetical protein